MNTDLLIQVIATGILVGGLYAIMSIGLSLSWGSLKIINLAHFSFILFGAYLTYQFTVWFGWDPFLTILLVFPLFFVAGGLMQVFFELANVDEFKSLIISFGFFIIFQSITRTLWTADFRRIGPDLNRWESHAFEIFGISIRTTLLAAFVGALLIATGTTLLLTKTHFGRAVRAVVQDREIARAFGIDQRRVAVILSGLATAYSGVAGVFIGIYQSLSPSISVAWFGIVFPVVILGGLGSTWGALGAGVIIGVAAGLATIWWGPLAAPLVTFSILIAALLFRPDGLFTRKSSV